MCTHTHTHTHLSLLSPLDSRLTATGPGKNVINASPLMLPTAAGSAPGTFSLLVCPNSSLTSFPWLPVRQFGATTALTGLNAPLSDGAAVSVSDFRDAENGFTAADFLSSPLEGTRSALGRYVGATSPVEDFELPRPESDACETCGLTLVPWVVLLLVLAAAGGFSLGSFLAWKLYLGSGCLSSTVSGVSFRWAAL